jgi:predicted AlkP superfamily phosphohydrolase/phosphomutase
MARKPQSLPLVIIGIDAGDPDFIESRAEQGYLPTLSSIMKRGCWGRTTGPELISEHGAWVSLFSGISRGEHGYYYFRQLKPGTYDLQAVTGLDIDAPPFWSYLLGREKKAAIIDVPDSKPLPGLPGLQLADWATHKNWDPHHFVTASEPQEVLREVRRHFGPKLVSIEKAESTFTEDRQIHSQLLDQVKKKGTLCRHLLSRDGFDLIVTVFAPSHAANHQFWKYRPGQGSVKEANGELTHAIRDIYQAIDREMGLLLAQLPRESNVFIVSSVGIEDHYPTTELIEAFFHQLGYQESPEANGASLRPIELVRRLIPEAWRIALSRHFPRETRERLLADQFRNGTNWRKTTAFAIPAYYTSFVRINLRGREPQGTVEPGIEYEALLDRIEADLKGLVDPQTNEPAVMRVARTIDLFDCEPHSSLPDLFVHWKPGRFMPRVVHPRAELVQKKQEFLRVSDHSNHGFVAAAGPSIRSRGALRDISLLNLAPTFLSLMGQSVPQKLTGKVIEAVAIGS